MGITEKVAYIKGLAEGLNINAETAEGKVLLAMIDALTDIADELDMIDETFDEMAEIVGDIEEDLRDVEEEVFGGECDCELDDDLYEITCDKCKNTVAVDIGMLEDGEVNCPNCGAIMKFDVESDDNGKE